MAVTYNVYKGPDDGGPVDYSTPIATGLAVLTWTGAAIPDATRRRYAVRAEEGGLEERNTDAQVLIEIGPAGEDLSGLPRPPAALRVKAQAGGTARVEWSYPYPGADRLPTEFRVYVTLGAVASYASPAATVAFSGASSGYRETISGLVDGASYVVAVRAVNASGEEANAVLVTVVGDSTAPSNVENLTATPVSG